MFIRRFFPLVFATYCRTLLRTLDCAHGSVHTLPCAQPYTAIYSGSMQEASCGSMISNSFFIIYRSLFIKLIFIIYLLIHCWVSAAAARCRHSAPCANFVYLFIIYLLFSACSGSMLQSSYSSMMPPIIFMICYVLFIIYYVVFAAAACV